MEQNLRLKEVVAEAGENQEIFATRIGIARTTLTKMLNNKLPVSEATALKVQNKYQINSQWIMTGIGSKEIAPVKPGGILDETTIFCIERLAEIGKSNNCQRISIDNLSIEFAPTALNIGIPQPQTEGYNDEIMFNSSD